MQAVKLDAQDQIKLKERVYRDMMIGVSHTEMSILSIIANHYINKLVKLNVTLHTSSEAGCKRTILRIDGPDLNCAIGILEDMVQSFIMFDKYKLRTENEVRILFGLNAKSMPYTDFWFKLKRITQYYASQIQRKLILVWH